jgi:WD40 repeat protein
VTRAHVARHGRLAAAVLLGLLGVDCHSTVRPASKLPSAPTARTVEPPEPAFVDCSELVGALQPAEALLARGELRRALAVAEQVARYCSDPLEARPLRVRIALAAKAGHERVRELARSLASAPAAREETRRLATLIVDQGPEAVVRLLAGIQRFDQASLLAVARAAKQAGDPVRAHDLVEFAFATASAPIYIDWYRPTDHFAEETQFSPDGRWLAWSARSRFDERALVLTAVDTGRELLVLARPINYEPKARFSDDGRWLATTEEASLFDLSSGEPVAAECTRQEQPPWLDAGEPSYLQHLDDVVFLPRDRVLWLGQWGAQIFDLKTGEYRLGIQAPDWFGCSSACAVSPDRRRLTVPGEGEIRLYDLDRGRLVRSIPFTEGATARVAFSDDGRWLAVNGPTFTILDATSGAEKQRLKSSLCGPAASVAFVAGRAELLCVGDAREIWDVGSGKLLVRASPDGDNVSVCALDHPVCSLPIEQRRLVADSSSGTWRMGLVQWPWAKGLDSLGAELEGTWDASLSRLALSVRTPRGPRSVVLDAKASRVLFEAPGEGPSRFLSNDRRLLAVDARESGNAVLVDTTDWRERARWVKDDGWSADDFAASHDGRWLAVQADNPARVEVWDVEQGLRREIPLVAGRVRSLLSRSSDRVGSVSSGRLRVWNLRTGQLAHSVPLTTRTALLLDDAVIELPEHGKLVRTELGTQELVRLDTSRQGRVLDFAGSERLLVLSRSGGSVELRDSSTLKLLRTLPVEPDPVERLALSDDAGSLAVMRRSGKLAVFRTSDLTLVGEARPKVSGHDGLAVSSDGSRLLFAQARDPAERRAEFDVAERICNYSLATQSCTTTFEHNGTSVGAVTADWRYGAFTACSHETSDALDWGGHCHADWIDLETGRVLGRLVQQPERLAVSPDGRTLSAWSAGSVQIYLDQPQGPGSRLTLLVDVSVTRDGLLVTDAQGHVELVGGAQREVGSALHCRMGSEFLPFDMCEQLLVRPGLLEAAVSELSAPP